jgi:hypothetical protein
LRERLALASGIRCSSVRTTSSLGEVRWGPYGTADYGDDPVGTRSLLPQIRSVVVVTDVKDNLVSLSDYSFQRTRARLQGLTDDEYLWEPVPNCWTIRLQPDGRYRADWAVPLAATGPFTTIAWRLWHLINCYGAERNATC